MAAAAPTIDNAKAAGRALTDAGAREVMVFGSVARGDAMPYSDIDLVAILDDVDYKQRWQTQLAWQQLAEEAAAKHQADVWVTDVPEWAAQNRLVSSLAAAVRPELVLVATGPRDDSAVRWDKQQALPASDIDAAYDYLQKADALLGTLSCQSTPPRPSRYASYRRAQQQAAVSEIAAALIENALRALGSAAQIDARALHSRDIATITAHLPGDDRAAARALVLSDGLRTYDEVTLWRALDAADYDDRKRLGLPTPSDIATATVAVALTAAALDTLEYASDKIARLHGRRQVNDTIGLAAGSASLVRY